MSLVKTRADHSDFAMILGVADSSTYDGRGLPSWLSPDEWQDICYVADMKVCLAQTPGRDPALIFKSILTKVCTVRAGILAALPWTSLVHEGSVAERLAMRLDPSGIVGADICL